MIRGASQWLIWGRIFYHSAESDDWTSYVSWYYIIWLILPFPSLITLPTCESLGTGPQIQETVAGCSSYLRHRRVWINYQDCIIFNGKRCKFVPVIYNEWWIIYHIINRVSIQPRNDMGYLFKWLHLFFLENYKNSELKWGHLLVIGVTPPCSGNLHDKLHYWSSLNLYIIILVIGNSLSDKALLIVTEMKLS